MQKVKSIDSSVVVHELEVAIKRDLYGLLSIAHAIFYFHYYLDVLYVLLLQ